MRSREHTRSRDDSPHSSDIGTTGTEEGHSLSVVLSLVLLFEQLRVEAVPAVPGAVLVPDGTALARSLSSILFY